MTTSILIFNLGPKGARVRSQYLFEDRWIDTEEPSKDLYHQGNTIPVIYKERRIIIEEIEQQ